MKSYERNWGKPWRAMVAEGFFGLCSMAVNSVPRLASLIEINKKRNVVCMYGMNNMREKNNNNFFFFDFLSGFLCNQTGEQKAQL